MKTFREFLQIIEGGMWSNPGIVDGKGTKRSPQKDLYNSRFDDTSGATGGPPAQPMQMPPKKAMKKK